MRAILILIYCLLCRSFFYRLNSRLPIEIDWDRNPDCGSLYIKPHPQVDTLADAIDDHREIGSLIIHEKLTGTRLYRGFVDPTERQRDIHLKQRIYQHSAKCPHALRTFLHRNPDYWCFIPKRWPQTQEENCRFRRDMSEESDDIHEILRQINNAGYQQISDYCANVPLQPAASHLSHKQLEQQREFFQNFLSLPIHDAPYTPTDVYRFKIIALLPEDAHKSQVTMLETLFAVHGQAKLNMSSVAKDDSTACNDRPYQLDWCKYLKHPPAWHRQGI